MVLAELVPGTIMALGSGTADATIGVVLVVGLDVDGFEEGLVGRFFCLLGSLTAHSL